MKKYTVSISIEVSFQIEVEASNEKQAKAQAENIALQLVDIEFKPECISPESYLVPISSEAIEEN